MNFSTIKTTTDYTSNTPSSSSSSPAATNRSKSDEDSSKLSRGRERWVWHAYDGDNATANHKSDTNIKINVKSLNPEWQPTPSDPNAAGPSRHGSLASVTHKAVPTSPRKATGKRKAYDAEVCGVCLPNKRQRREDDEHTHATTPGSISSSQLEDRLDEIAITAGTVQSSFDADTRKSTSIIKQDLPLAVEDPDLSAADALDDAQPTERDAPIREEGDEDDFQTFLNSIVEGFNAKTESPTKSGDKKQSFDSDPFEKLDRKHAASAAASYRWSDLYTPPRNELISEGSGAHWFPTPARAPRNEVRYGRVAATASIAPRQDAKNKLPILGDISQETMPASSSRTPGLATLARTPDIQANRSQPIKSSDPASDASATDTAPDIPFRYTLETEADIRDAVLEAKYSVAYSLFEPSERIKTIDGDEVKRFVSEHPDKVTMVGRKAPRLWVCQATATWAADGTVTYAPAACGVACTSRDICMRHIYTGHLAKVRGRTAPQ